MTKSKLPLSAITLFENRFNNEIDLNVQSSKTLLPGEIVHSTPEKLFINFNLKGLIEDKFSQLIGKNFKHTESFDKKEKKTNIKLDSSNFSSKLNSIKKLL